MILNLLVIAFVLGMAYWYALQGLFTAFTHILVVIAAGSMALALWEPLVINFLAYRMPAFAWGVGLLAPFALLLIFLRLAVDRLVPMNLQFPNLANLIGGGVLGALSGVLTAGFLIIGIGFFPLPPRTLGYQPYVVAADGELVPNE